MPADDTTPDPDGAEQRRALERSERAASADQPKTFRDEAIEDKIVEVDPIGRDDAAIKGLDPK